VRSCSDCRRVCQEPGSLADELKQLTDSSVVLRSIEDEPSITNCPGDLIPSVATRDSNVQSRATDSPATAACGERNALSISESPQVPRVHLGLVASRETQRHGLRRIAVPAWCALERLTLLKELVGVVLERRRLPACSIRATIRASKTLRPAQPPPPSVVNSIPSTTGTIPVGPSRNSTREDTPTSRPSQPSPSRPRAFIRIDALAPAVPARVLHESRIDTVAGPAGPVTGRCSR
jgi:hypothetical protein